MLSRFISRKVSERMDICSSRPSSTVSGSRAMRTFLAQGRKVLEPRPLSIPTRIGDLRMEW